MWLTVALAFAAGASIPGTPTAVRALCTTLIDDQQLRVTAYAMLAMASTSAAVLGPLLVSALLAGGATAAVLATAALAAATGIAYSFASASRRGVPRASATRCRPRARATRWRPRSLGTPGMRTLAAVSAANGVVLGLISVAVPAFALSRHTTALAGELSAVSAAGDLVGGVIYGGRSWSLSLRTRLAAALLVLAASCAALGVLPGDVAAVAVGLAVFGAVEAVTGITLTALIQHVAPDGAHTESYAIIISATLAGTAAGNLAAGELAGTSVRLVFAAAAGAAVAAAAWTMARDDSDGTRAGRQPPGEGDDEVA